MTVKAVSSAWLCLMLLATPSARAEDARLPYQAICRMRQTQLELSRIHTNLILVLQMRSTDTNVKNGDIAVSIHAKTGPIPIPLGPGGIFNLPVRDDLMAENPWIFVNQPKGTMELNWHAGLAPSLARRITNPFHYADPMRAVRECDDVQNVMRQFFPDAPLLTAAGLRLSFSSSSIAPAAIIHAKNGDRRLTANASCELVLPLDEDLMMEDPLITLTENPVSVEIAMRKSQGGP